MDRASTNPPKFPRRRSASIARQLGFASRRNAGRTSTGGYTLIEVMVVTALLTILATVAFASIYTGKQIARRMTDYTAALQIVEAKMQDIRVATYNPPTAPFGSTATTITNNYSIDLNQTGATFIVSGTVVSKFEPIANGHLVTVTGTFQTPHKPITVTLQSVVNKYSGGQQ